MSPIYFCLVAAALCCVAVSMLSAAEATNNNNENEKLMEEVVQKDMSEEMNLINKSLEGLLAELAAIKREATGRLSQVRKGGVAPSSQADHERIRQTKVSRFVLKRVAELESESLGMRDEMVKLYELSQKTSSSAPSPTGRSGAQSKQEDIDFDELPASTTQKAAAPTTTTTTTTTTSKPDQEEAAQIGFDLEQLKRLGNELESEIEGRQAQNPQGLRGVHEQIIRLTNQMVQNYLGHVRRVVHRFNNLVDNRRSGQQLPRQSPNTVQLEEINQVSKLSASVLDQLQDMSKRFQEFSVEWSLVGRQQSPLIDRIPPRGVELWRDFWDTVRKQVRRVNQEFLQLTRDMTRVLTGRQPSYQNNNLVIVRPREGQEEPAPSNVGLGSLLYSGAATLGSEAAIQKQFQEFYDKLGVQLKAEQHKMDAITKASSQRQQQLIEDKQTINNNNNNLIEEMDDEQTRLALSQNPGLRQQISQDINVFSSIFDIIKTFLTRLRGSAEDIRNILERPGAMRDNNSVTPGPAIKPTVDELLKDTIDSQRNINSQAKPASG